MTYEDIRDKSFYYIEITDGFEIYDEPNGEMWAFIYSYAENRDEDRKAIESCSTISELDFCFDDISYQFDPREW